MPKYFRITRIVLLFVCWSHGSPLALGAEPSIRLPSAWEYGSPLVSPEDREVEPSHAQKDPSFVLHAGAWHLFMTAKLPDRSAIEYCSFDTWDQANDAARILLPLSESDYFCAPQIFFFAPQQKWYLVYQVGVPNQKKMWVAYSTTEDITRPESWTPARPMLDGGADDPRVVGGLDYWVICDSERAYLFFTSLDGRMWRMWTALDDFPKGFAHCEVALHAEVFEASHTYRIAGQEGYLTLIEQRGQRHFKAYTSDRLDGVWTALADSEAAPFAGAANIRPAAGAAAWTDCVSHGELVRLNNDQRLVIDPENLQFVFQGAVLGANREQTYGQLPWRIGILKRAPR